ncbi:MAG TPA: ATP-binding protein [Flavipsychrobacter sp.]|nr:ATP-binding protein [Flavipsychrobacter sp.]
MKKRLRIIVSAFSVSFILMAAFSFFSISRFDNLYKYSYWIERTNKVIQEIYKTEASIESMEHIERNYMLTHDTNNLIAFNNSVDETLGQTAILKYYTSDNTVEQNNLIMLRTILSLAISDIRLNLAYTDTSHSGVLSPYFYEARKNMLECLQITRKMYNNENNILKKRNEDKVFYERLTFNTIKYLIIVFSALTVFLFILMISELRRRIIYQDELQTKVIDLTRSHSELEQIAYAASHDLQEPLRKIQVFSNRFLWLKKDSMDEETSSTMDRINKAASRMQDLIEDLVNLTSLTKDEGNKEDANLNKIARFVIEELDEKIKEKKAIISIGELPAIKGHPRQLSILFKALLDNALKFSREGVIPAISITNEIVNGEELIDINKKLSQKKFNRISISDNGIGFNNKFADKMFQIFQRLHNQYSGYSGKGIGLAICQRIMANHEGYILAHGHLEAGATFKLFFPIDEK